MTDRKKPTAGFWITVALVVVLVGYPLSWGPYMRLQHLGYDHWLPIGIIYRPLDWLDPREPAWLAHLYYDGYVLWWTSDLADTEDERSP